VPACTCASATNANLPQRHARCQGRRSLEWVTARREVASAARMHAHQPTTAAGSPTPSAGPALSTRLRIMNWEEGRAGKRGPCPLLGDLKRRQNLGDPDPSVACTRSQIESTQPLKSCHDFAATSPQQASTDDCFVIRLGTELETPAGDLHGEHPYVERLQRRGPRQQLRFLGL